MYLSIYLSTYLSIYYQYLCLEWPQCIGIYTDPHGTETPQLRKIGKSDSETRKVRLRNSENQFLGLCFWVFEGEFLSCPVLSEKIRHENSQNASDRCKRSVLDFLCQRQNCPKLSRLGNSASETRKLCLGNSETRTFWVSELEFLSFWVGVSGFLSLGGVFDFPGFV